MDNGNIENHENVILGGCNEIKPGLNLSKKKKKTPGLQVNFEEKACNISIDYHMFSFSKNALRKYLNVTL